MNQMLMYGVNWVVCFNVSRLVSKQQGTLCR